MQSALLRLPTAAGSGAGALLVLLSFPREPRQPPLFGCPPASPHLGGGQMGGRHPHNASLLQHVGIAGAGQYLSLGAGKASLCGVTMSCCHN